MLKHPQTPGSLEAGRPLLPLTPLRAAGCAAAAAARGLVWRAGAPSDWPFGALAGMIATLSVGGHSHIAGASLLPRQPRPSHPAAAKCTSSIRELLNLSSGIVAAGWSFESLPSHASVQSPHVPQAICRARGLSSGIACQCRRDSTQTTDWCNMGLPWGVQQMPSMPGMRSMHKVSAADSRLLNRWQSNCTVSIR